MGGRAIIMLIFGLGGVAVSLFRPFYGLLITVFLYFFRPDLYGAELYIEPVKWLTIAVLIGWLFNEPKQNIFKNMGLLLLFLLMIVLSTYLAPFSNALTREKLNDFLKIFVFVFLIINIVNTPQRLVLFVLSILAGTFYLAKIAIFSWAGQGFGGDIRVDAAASQGGGANFLAWVFAATLPFLLTKLFYGSKWERNISRVLSVLWIVSLIATGSRGGFLALVGGGFIYLIIQKKIKIILVSLVIVITTFLLIPEEYKARMSTITTNKEEMDSSSLQRIGNWKAARKIMLSYPIFGSGLGTFPQVSADYFDEDFNLVRGFFVQHNLYYQIGSDTGMVALVIFFLISIFVLVGVFRKKVNNLHFNEKDKEYLEFFRLSYVPGLFAILISSTFGNFLLYDLLWWFYAMGFAFIRITSLAKLEQQVNPACSFESIAPSLHDITLKK